MKPGFYEEFVKPFAGETNLLIGCGQEDRPPGFISVDMDHQHNPDIIARIGYDNLTHKLRYLVGKVDLIVAPHVLEHLDWDHVIIALRQFHDLLKPGGHLIAITPHGRSDDAWENPLHRSWWTARTWAYLSKSLYETTGHSGYRADQGHQFKDWETKALREVAFPEAIAAYQAETDGDPQKFKVWAEFRPNVWREVQVLLRKKGGS